MKEFEKALSASDYKVINVELEVLDKLVADKHSLQTVKFVMVKFCLHDNVAKSNTTR